jgi:FixJ family two-component response regulator
MRPVQERFPMDFEPRVFVVDDEGTILRAVERLLASHGYRVSAFSSPKAFLDELPYPGPACLVLDMSMPELSGLDVQKMLSVKAMALPTIFLSGTSDVPGAAEAMRKGAIDFLVKPVDGPALLESVSRALAAAVERRRRQHEAEDVHARLARLTKRERQVCDLIAKGLLNKHVACELGISEKTIKVHRGRVMRKLDTDSVAALVWMLSRVSTPGLP